MLIYIMLTIAILASFTTFLLYKMLVMLYKEKEIEDNKIEKFYKFYLILVRWVWVKQNKIDFYSYFKRNNYETVAIYGMKELGQLLVGELRNKNIKVSYAIDQQADKIETDLSVYKPLDKLPPVDVIIVTAPSFFNEIYVNLKKDYDYNVISIEDLLWSIG